MKPVVDFLRELFSAPVDAAEAARRTAARYPSRQVPTPQASIALAPAARPQPEISSTYFEPAPSEAALAAAIGTWRVTACGMAEDEVALIEQEAGDDGLDPEAIDRWLNGHAGNITTNTHPAHGLELRIESSGGFHELSEGSTKLIYYDADGVQSQAPGLMEGQVVSNGTHLYLRLRGLPPWSVPRDGAHGPALLRLDDGDTKIADRIDVSGDTLVRSLSVVTDELYLERIALVYRRVGAEAIAPAE